MSAKKLNIEDQSEITILTVLDVGLGETGEPLTCFPSRVEWTTKPPTNNVSEYTTIRIEDYSKSGIVPGIYKRTPGTDIFVKI
jgi:hypothetical protein